MIRFILNFIFFGVLFFCIWKFFPEAFDKLVHWASAVYDFLAGIVQMIIDKVGPMFSRKSHDTEPKTLFFSSILSMFI